VTVRPAKKDLTPPSGDGHFDWASLNAEYGDEISNFQHLVWLLGGTADGFRSGLRQFARHHQGKLDPLGGIVEMVVLTQASGSKTLAELDDLTDHLEEMRRIGFEDWSNRLTAGKEIRRRLEALEDSERDYQPRFVKGLLQDGIRILDIEAINSGVFRQWRERVLYHLLDREPNASERRLIPFLEVLIRYEADIERLVTSIRLPSPCCYRASFYRLHIERALSIVLEEVPEHLRDTVEMWRMQYRCGWLEAREDVKAWWRQATLDNFRSSLKIVRHLNEIGASQNELHDCMEKTKSDNVQGNLHYLRYVRRKSTRDKFRELMSRRSIATSEREQREFDQRISKDFRFWDA
jgi:hypothetical protein